MSLPQAGVWLIGRTLTQHMWGIELNPQCVNNNNNNNNKEYVSKYTVYGIKAASAGGRACTQV